MLAEVMGDFDGDGTSNDRFSLLRFPAGSSQPWVTLPYGYSAGGAIFLSRLWAADAGTVNLGGPADVVAAQIVLDAGRSAYLWAFHDCNVHILQEPDSLVVGFPLVDTLREKRGLTCLDDGVRVTWANSTDGITWEVGEYKLRYYPATASLLEPLWFGPGEEPMELVQFLHSPEDDDLIRGYAAFDC